jgi:V8-like Glu-specific endopeptidase
MSGKTLFGATGELESPFLSENLFAGESNEQWEAQVVSIASESPFREALPEERLFEGDGGAVANDDRAPVRDRLEIPYRWICQISVRKRKDGKLMSFGPAATGLLISPRHVLTAAHVLKNSEKNDHNQWVDDEAELIKVAPARHGKDIPLGTYEVASWQTSPKWDPRRADSYKWDYGIITLKKPIGSWTFRKTKDKRLGYWGAKGDGGNTYLEHLTAKQLEHATGYTAGYPEDRGGAVEMMAASGQLLGVDLHRRQEIMNMSIPADHGQSGSPIWVQIGERRCLAGIVTQKNTGEANLALRVNDEVIKQIETWTGADRESEMEWEEDEDSEAVEEEDAEFEEPETGEETEAEDLEEMYSEAVLEELEEYSREQESLGVDLEDENFKEFIEKCYDVTTTKKGVVPAIGFEFDTNYSPSTVNPPVNPADGLGSSVYVLEDKHITTHRYDPDGFRTKGDGNRIELATKPFELTDAGRKEMSKVMKTVASLIAGLQKQCGTVKPLKTPKYPATAGQPRPVKPTYLESGIACVVPLNLNPKRSYYASECALGASPQATFTLPLARIDTLVARIEKSEKSKIAGVALSGPKGFRQGVRSVALYDARNTVNQSRDQHIRAGTKLSNGDAVTSSNFSPTLQGLLILMVSYLRTSEIPYGTGDYEEFAKAYLPLNVKNPFRLLFADLTADEKRVFTELYDNPRANLWRLAKPSATPADGNNQLFPAKVKGHQECWFTSAPTWDDFVERTVKNTPLKRIKFCKGAWKEGEDVGCEVLFGPLSRIIPYEVGSRRVTVEMRRLGFNWVMSHAHMRDGVKHPGWIEMTAMLFDIARELNK